MTPKELKRIADELEERKAREAIEKMRKRDADQGEMHETFMAQELRPGRAGARVGRGAASCAERPARGPGDKVSRDLDQRPRPRINNAEADWPASLEDFAKRAYDYYEGAAAHGLPAARRGSELQ